MLGLLNFEINAYHQVMPMIRALKARFIGVSPQLPNHRFSQRERKKLLFDVLYDQSNQLARELGIAFELDEALKEIYTEFGYDIPLNNGNEKWELPISATYIVRPDRRIGQFFVDADYVHRTDPQQVIRFLELIKHETRGTCTPLYKNKGI